jgi:hypothetical protein
VEAAFEVAEHQRDGLDALRIGEILEPFLLDRVRGDAFLAVFLGFQIQLFELSVGKLQVFAQFGSHTGVCSP